MAKTPGFNCRIAIAFTADKHGRPIAYRWSFPGMRWIRMGYDAAKLHVAAGEADEIRYVK
jgi:hypothetical protein